MMAGVATRWTRRWTRRETAIRDGPTGGEERDDVGVDGWRKGRRFLSYAPFSVAHLYASVGRFLLSFRLAHLLSALFHPLVSYRICRRGLACDGRAGPVSGFSPWRVEGVWLVFFCSHSRGIFIPVGIRGSVCFSPCRFAGGIGAPFLSARSSALFRGGIVSSCVSSLVSLSVSCRPRCLPWCPVRPVRRLVLSSRVAARSPPSRRVSWCSFLSAVSSCRLVRHAVCRIDGCLVGWFVFSFCLYLVSSVV